MHFSSYTIPTYLVKLQTDNLAIFSKVVEDRTGLGSKIHFSQKFKQKARERDSKSLHIVPNRNRTPPPPFLYVYNTYTNLFYVYSGSILYICREGVRTGKCKLAPKENF